MRVLAFGTYDSSVHPRAAVLLEGLASRGFDVREMNVRLGLGTQDRVAMLRGPWRLPVLAARLLGCWAQLLLRSLKTDQPDVVLVPYLGHFDVILARARWPRQMIVLDHLVSAEGTARDRGVTGRLRLALLRCLDRAALAAADVVVVDTRESAERLPKNAQKKAVVVPVGASAAWFSAGTGRAERLGAPLQVVFFGSFTPLQGTTTIARAIAMLDEGLLSITLIGTGQDHDEVRELIGLRRDVEWRDWVPGPELPGVVATYDVCLGIFGGSDKAVSVVPTKIYQGAAAGCALVTSDTAPQRRALDGGAALTIPADPASLASALASLAASPHEVRRLQNAARARAECFAAPQVVSPLVDLLEKPRQAMRG